jgi:hypothetical protein
MKKVKAHEIRAMPESIQLESFVFTFPVSKH